MILLKTPEDLKVWRDVMTTLGKHVVATNGCFDILHAQHIKHLHQARYQGDALLIGIDSDARVRRLKGEGRPVNKAEDRAAVLMALQGVDAVYIFDTESEDFLALARPDVWVKGGDYSIGKLRPQERTVLEQCGGEIVILPLHEGDSTSSIVKRIKLSGNNIVIPFEPELQAHGGPGCDCHHSVQVDPPPMREATDADWEKLGLAIAQTGCPPGMVPKVVAVTELAMTGTIVPVPISVQVDPLKRLVSDWQARAAKERLVAGRNPGSAEALKATATALAYEAVAVELSEALRGGN